jgi:excisionase family DNA binding protein
MGREPSRTLNLLPQFSTQRVRAGVARLRGGRRGATDGQAFAPLLDAKAASRLLGVPHTWLLAQARAGRIPHHRLGHYVRFNADDLADWLHDNRHGPEASPGRRT